MLHTATAASAGPTNAAVVAAFAPTGQLRAAINLGNPVLAALDPHSGEAVGVSVDLAKRLGIGLQLIVVKSAGAVSWATRYCLMRPLRMAAAFFSGK